MCHTRELAFQISKEYERFSKYMPSVKVSLLRCCAVLGTMWPSGATLALGAVLGAMWPSGATLASGSSSSSTYQS